MAVATATLLRPGSADAAEIDFPNLVDCRGPFIVNLPIGQRNVDKLLLRLLGMPNLVNSRIEIAGTAARPSWAGMCVVRALRARGNTVLVN